MYIDQQGGKLGGLPVEPIFEDTETKAELVVTKTRKLIEEDKVHLMAGAMLAFEGLAMLDTINKAKIALVGFTGVAADEWPREKTKYVSGASKHTASQETMPLGDYAYNELGYRKVAILGQDYSWGWQTTGGFQYAFEQAGGDVVQKLWAPIGTTDYAPFVTQIRKDVDAVYVTLIGADVPRFVKAYSDYGLKDQIPMLGSEDMVAEDAIRYYGPEAAGIVGITPFTPNLDRPEMQDFVQAYQERTGNLPTFWGESAYVGAMIIDRTLQELQDEGVSAQELPDYVRTHAAKFIETIQKIDLSDAPSSPIEVADTNWAIRNFYLVKLEDDNGKITDNIIHTFTHVGQFWTFKPSEFLANPVFSRKFPPVSG
jgi:branched-chain amino acid transport system substrate-binding protein